MINVPILDPERVGVLDAGVFDADAQPGALVGSAVTGEPVVARAVLRQRQRSAVQGDPVMLTAVTGTVIRPS